MKKLFFLLLLLMCIQSCSAVKNIIVKSQIDYYNSEKYITERQKKLELKRTANEAYRQKQFALGQNTFQVRRTLGKPTFTMFTFDSQTKLRMSVWYYDSNHKYVEFVNGKAYSYSNLYRPNFLWNEKQKTYNYLK